MKNTLVFNLGLAALLAFVAASGARADTITFQGTLSNPVDGGTSVSGQFGFDFATDAVTSYMFTVPGDTLDSTVVNDATVGQITSSGTRYLVLQFRSEASDLILVVNPAITKFFTQEVIGTIGAAHSEWVCATDACFSGTSRPTSDFASGTVSGSTAVIPEPSTWALMALGFAGLGFAGWRSQRRSISIAA
jgi:hypothetical protein